MTHTSPSILLHVGRLHVELTYVISPINYAKERVLGNFNLPIRLKIVYV